MEYGVGEGGGIGGNRLGNRGGGVMLWTRELDKVAPAPLFPKAKLKWAAQTPGADL